MMPQYRAADNVPEATIYSVRNAQAMLRNGFTTIRDVGGGAGIDLAIRDAIANGAIVGPRVLAAGQALTITGGHGDSNDVPGWVDEDPTVTGRRRIVRARTDSAKSCAQHVKLHVDVIKILATGGVLSYGDVWDIPQFNLDEVQAVVEESTKFQRKVAAHAHGDPGIADRGRGRRALRRARHRREREDAARTCSSAAPASCRRSGRSTPSCSPAIRIAFRRNRCAKPQYAAELRNAGMHRAIAVERHDRLRHRRRRLSARAKQQDFALIVGLGMRPIDVLRRATVNAAAAHRHERPRRAGARQASRRRRVPRRSHARHRAHGTVAGARDARRRQGRSRPAARLGGVRSRETGNDVGV